MMRNIVLLFFLLISQVALASSEGCCLSCLNRCCGEPYESIRSIITEADPTLSNFESKAELKEYLRRRADALFPLLTGEQRAKLVLDAVKDWHQGVDKFSVLMDAGYAGAKESIHLTKALAHCCLHDLPPATYRITRLLDAGISPNVPTPDIVGRLPLRIVLHGCESLCTPPNSESAAPYLMVLQLLLDHDADYSIGFGFGERQTIAEYVTQPQCRQLINAHCDKKYRAKLRATLFKVYREKSDQTLPPELVEMVAGYLEL